MQDTIIEVSVSLNMALGVLSSLRGEEWITYRDENVQVVLEDVVAHLGACYSILERENIRLQGDWDGEKWVPSKKKVNKKKVAKALAELRKGAALWKLLVSHKLIEEDGKSKKYFPKTGFWLVSKDVDYALEKLRTGKTLELDVQRILDRVMRSLDYNFKYLGEDQPQVTKLFRSYERKYLTKDVVDWGEACKLMEAGIVLVEKHYSKFDNANRAEILTDIEKYRAWKRP